MVNHRLTKTNYVTSVHELKTVIVNTIPTILLVGRSNVGKSSIFNYLTNTKLARVSKIPGRTQALNIFEALLNNKQIHIVDSPGLGYANLSIHKQNLTNSLLTDYLNLQKQIFCLLHIVDSNIPLNIIDCELSKTLKNTTLNYCLLITKIDRIPISKRNDIKNYFTETLRLNTKHCFCTSAKKNIGKKSVLESLSHNLETYSNDGEFVELGGIEPPTS